LAIENALPQPARVTKVQVKDGRRPSLSKRRLLSFFVNTIRTDGKPKLNELFEPALELCALNLVRGRFGLSKSDELIRKGTIDAFWLKARPVRSGRTGVEKGGGCWR
jgi:hypothetical protein